MSLWPLQKKNTRLITQIQNVLITAAAIKNAPINYTLYFIYNHGLLKIQV